MVAQFEKRAFSLLTLLALLFCVPVSVRAQAASKTGAGAPPPEDFQLVQTTSNPAPSGNTPAPAASEPDPAIFMSIIPPNLTDDMFGHRLSQRYLAIQVTVINQSPDRDLIINDISVDYGALNKDACMAPAQRSVGDTSAIRAKADQVLSLIRTLPKETASESDVLAMTEVAKALRSQLSAQSSQSNLVLCSTSSHDLSILRGVAERGQVLDPRNIVFRVMTGIGIIGGGLTGVAGLGPVLPKAVAAFNGPGISAFVSVFPDFTLNQMNRLSDSAYSTNTVVPKTRSKIAVAFIPINLLLDAADISPFRKDPHKFFLSIPNRHTTAASSNTPAGLKDLLVQVEYNYIVSTDDVPPIPSDVQLISDKETAGFLDKSDVHGYVAGQFLDGAQVAIGNGDALGLKAEIDSSRPSTDNRLYFVLKVSKPVAPGTDISFQVIKKKNTATLSKAFTFPVESPTLTKIDPASGAAGADVMVTFTGTNLYDLGAKVVIQQAGQDDSSIAVSGLTMSGTTATATLSLKNAMAGKFDVALSVNGQTTGTQTFEVTAKP